jgi:tRNA-specific 2-thiouridylase
MLGQYQLSKTMFPVGGLNKSQVREIAREYNLKTAAKKDSTGICFIGERKFKEFLSNYLPAKSGEIKTLSGETIGHHDGLMYYTLGQRKGLGIGGHGNGEPWFVVDKDLDSNVLYVVQGDQPSLYSNGLYAVDINWINNMDGIESLSCTAKFRYRQPDQKVTVFLHPDKSCDVVFDKPQKAVTPGQAVVFYNDEVCLGGGTIETIFKGELPQFIKDRL